MTRMIGDSDSIHIIFLGTGAADWPAPCTPSTNEAQNSDVRGHSSVIVDGQILIDCGASVPDAIHRFGAHPKGITDILLTHTHYDHFDIDAIGRLTSERRDKPDLNLWAHPSALSKLPDIEGVSQYAVQVGEPFELPPMTATGLAANHQYEEETALHFLLQKSEISVLYAADGAWFLKSTWEYLRETILDAVIWDATCGETQGDWRIFDHNSVDMVNIMRQTLTKAGVLSPYGRVFLTHMSKALCASHVDMTRRLIPQGLIPAYDGLDISIRGAEQQG
jgi:L-ascorbate metabolism protein UlaG (beta-lactamase superfamily)